MSKLMYCVKICLKTPMKNHSICVQSNSIPSWRFIYKAWQGKSYATIWLHWPFYPISDYLLIEILREIMPKILPASSTRSFWLYSICIAFYYWTFNFNSFIFNRKIICFITMIYFIIDSKIIISNR